MLATEVDHLILQIKEHMQQSFSQQYKQLLYTNDKTEKFAYFCCVTHRCNLKSNVSYSIQSVPFLELVSRSWGRGGLAKETSQLQLQLLHGYTRTPRHSNRTRCPI